MSAPTRVVHPRLLAAVVRTVVALGGAVVLYSLYHLPDVSNGSAWALLSVLGIVAASFAIKVPGVPAYLSISDAFFMSAGLLFGPAPAALTIAMDSAVVSVRRKGDLRQTSFNVTSSALALWGGTQVFFALAGHGPMAESLRVPDERTVLPLACMALTYFALNSGLMAVAVGLSRGQSPWRFWREHFAVMTVNYFAAGSAAYFLVLLIRHVGIGALAIVTPLLLVCHLAMRSWFGRAQDAQRHLGDLNRLYLSTISAFSTAIEAKDGVTSDHIHRVQAYAMGLARALGLTDEPTLKAIEAAALLHDTGKLAIPEHILNKPGKLTAVEFDTMKMHVDIGADILSSIDFPYPVVPIVRAHHENWNGTGYPRRLTGADIPIGARILSVVDCFDALTSDRPYRPALDDEAAITIILQNRGTMYDPHVVDTFARVYRDIGPTSLPEPKLEKLLTAIRGTSAAAEAPAPVAAPAAPVPSTELLAFVSLSRLASGTSSLADLGALTESHLRHIAPGATVALFGLDATRIQLTAQYVSGPAAAAVSGLSVRLGERLTGWVGANARAMMNGDARLDLGSDTTSPLRSACAMPLMSGADLVGVLTLYAAAPFTDDQMRTVEMIVPHLSAAAGAVRTTTADAEARRSRSGIRVVARRPA